MPPVGDAAKIELANVPENIKVNTPANLTLRMNGAKGTLDGEVVDPSGRKDDAFMCCLDSGKRTNNSNITYEVLSFNYYVVRVLTAALNF